MAVNPIQPESKITSRLAVTLVVGTILMIGTLFYEIRGAEKFLRQLQSKDIPVTELGGILVRLDQLLTQSAHLYAVTADPRWSSQYERNAPAGAEATEQLRALASQSLGDMLSRKALERTEHAALDLARQGDLVGATELIESGSYRREKDRYHETIASLTMEFSEKRAQKLDYYAARVKILAISVGIAIFLLAVGWIYLVMDFRQNLSRRRKAEALVKEQQIAILSAAKMSTLGEMAGGVAHEINNPLAIIQLHAGQLRDTVQAGKVEPEAAVSLLNVIERTAIRIASIVKGLRAFAREADNDPMCETSVRGIIEDTLALCSERFRTQGIRIATGPISEYLNVECRGTQLSQVLLNLMGNAFDAVCDLPDRWVRVEAEDLGDRIVLSVTDAGHGIEPGVREKIFQPFFTTKPVGRGTGLGLSISKGIIESHGGTLMLDPSSPNTRFVIELHKKRGERAAA